MKRLIVGALVARFAFALVLGLTQLVPHNGWYWENKDQLEYYATAHALLHGAYAPIYTFMGYGVLIAPFVIGTHFVLQAIAPVAIVQLLLAIPAAFVLFRAGERLLDRRSAAIGTALWLTAPIWLSPIWFRSYSRPFNMASWWLGLNISVDYATALLAIAAVAVAAGGRDDGSLTRGLAAGALAGATILCKPSNAVLLAVVAGAFAVWRRWGAAAAALVAGGIVSVPQLVLDWRISGRPFHIQYWSAWPYGHSKPLSSIAYVPRTFGKLLLLNYTGPLLMLAFVAALVITWRRFPQARLLIVAQVVLYALFFSVLFYSISEFMLRFMTTALPALCLACGAGLTFRREPGPPPAPARPLGLPALALGVTTLAGAVALAVFVGVAPSQPVLPVVASLRPTVTPARRAGWVTVSFRAPSSNGVAYAYRVNRSRGPAAVDETSIWTGVKTRIRDRPGRGVWWYRVYVEPSAHPHGQPIGTHPFAVSAPGRVALP